MKRQRNEHDEVTVTLRALCTVSNFNYICLISSMKIRLPLLCTGAVSACGHEMNLELGKQIHGLAIKSGYGSHVSVCNVLISTYSKCEVTEDAKLVFQCMNDRNVVSCWTTMISVDEEDVFSLFNEMRLDGVYPNDVTFVGLIHAISVRKLVEEGEMIYGFFIKTGFLSNHNVCNSLITIYAKLESMHDSKFLRG
ncbi:unnamed protein product [Prunus armeniaca]